MNSPIVTFIPGDSTAAAVAHLPYWAGGHHNADKIRVDSSGIGHEDGSACWANVTEDGAEPFVVLMVTRRLCEVCHVGRAVAA